jgi:predicted nucleotide-binding protein
VLGMLKFSLGELRIFENCLQSDRKNMRPRIFVGSSTERLEIAYAVQENLDHDAQVTVWTQGIFKLSTTSLDSLIAALDKFDFAIFIFHPDDSTQMRNRTFDTVRDNLIFELGLFIGRFGKDKVFFLIPRTIEKLHLPTDLLGITPGTYDNLREDGNLLASLAPFCNQIRTTLKDFVYLNIEDIQGEPHFIKKIVIEKEKGWEQLFAAELFGLRLTEINKSYEEIADRSAILRFKPMTGQEYFDWFRKTLDDITAFIDHFAKCLENLEKSFGPTGVAGKPIEIKNAVERFILLCRELLNIEYEIYSIKPPDEFLYIKQKMDGWTRIMFIDETNRLHTDLKQLILDYRTGKLITGLTLNLALKVPGSITQIVEDFTETLGKHG